MPAKPSKSESPLKERKSMPKKEKVRKSMLKKEKVRTKSMPGIPNPKSMPGIPKKIDGWERACRVLA
jgi:hypothetical protein